MNNNVLVVKAREFVYEKHAGQKYGDHPYTRHLEDVHQIIREFQPMYAFTEHIEAAALLHDVVEDTPVKAMDIYECFGQRVGDIVFAVTNENGRNRKERTVKTMLKVKEAGTGALAVKLADRLANARFSKSNGSPQYLMYQKEYPFLRWFLKGAGLKMMWEELDRVLISS